MQSRPKLSWDADPNELYFLMLEDNDVALATSGGAVVTGKHWIVTNIPGIIASWIL